MYEGSESVFNGAEDVGEYKINQDGRIEIEFTEEFLESEGSIRGNINFNARVFIKDDSERGEILFPGTSNTIVIEKNENKDIKIEKNGEKIKTGTKSGYIKYEVVVSTENGTPEEVIIRDNINEYNTNGVDYEYQQNSFEIYKNNRKIDHEINFEWSWVLALRQRSLQELLPIDIMWGWEVSGGPMS